MSTIVLKQSFWKDFERTFAWKYIFWAVDCIMFVVTIPAFFFFVLITPHTAETKGELYSPSAISLAVILAFSAMFLSSPSLGLSSLSILLIDILFGLFLVGCVYYQCWVEDYKEKMGYPKRFNWFFKIGEHCLTFFILAWRKSEFY